MEEKVDYEDEEEENIEQVESQVDEVDGGATTNGCKGELCDDSNRQGNCWTVKDFGFWTSDVRPQAPLPTPSIPPFSSKLIMLKSPKPNCFYIAIWALDGIICCFIDLNYGVCGVCFSYFRKVRQ